MMAAETLQPGTTLGALLEGFTPAGIWSSVGITGVALDSRRVERGDLFLALSGHRGHGADHIGEAVSRGAAAVAVEAARPDTVPTEFGGVPVVAVPALGEAAGHIAARLFGHPARDLQVVGVTGTNGKSSVSHFIAQALAVEAPCGLIGTLGSGLYGALRPIGRTTPDPVTLQAELAAQRAQGARWSVLEVSSHGLHQGRVNGVHFTTAVFTNLSHDHLDYHGDMAAYAEAKRRLFTMPGLRSAVLNLDDPVARDWLQSLPPEVTVIGYGVEEAARLCGVPLLEGLELTRTSTGMRLRVRGPWGEGELDTPLFGQFNAANLLAALGALLALECPFDEALRRLGQVRTVPGRMERFGGGDAPTVVVDYAHTPDALEQALQAVRPHTAGHLWCLFGCGGERDRAKRPRMGAVAERLADRVVLTDDNPRTEPSAAIIDAILAGMERPERAEVIPDRGAAIAWAIEQARPGDLLLIAGKGHESVQERGGERLPFSDRTTVQRLLPGGAHG